MIKRLAVLLALLIFVPFAKCGEKSVSLGEREIFTPQHGSVQDLSADELAVVSTYRLEEILKDKNTSPEDIKIKTSNGIYLIQAKDKTILELDHKKLQLNKLQTEKKARQIVSVLKKQFSELKERQLSISLLVKFLLAFIYPILLVLALIGIRLFYRKSLFSIYTLEDRRVKGFSIGRFEVLSLKKLKVVLRTLLIVLTAVSVLVALYIFLAATFYYFPVTRKYAYEMYEFIRHLGSGIGYKLLKFIWRAALTVITLVFWFTFIGAIDKHFDDVSEGKVKPFRFVKFEHIDIFEYLAKALTTLTTLVIIIFILPGKGEKFGTAILAFIGLALALAFSGVFKNLAAGFLIAFSQSHNRGANLLMNGEEAVILRTGVFFTSLRFSRGEIKLIPNWQILKAQVRVVPSGDIVTWQGKLKAVEGVEISNIQAELEQWVSKWGNAQAKITAIENDIVDFEMTIPFIESSSEVFISAAFDDLQKLMNKHKIKVLKLALKSQ